MTASSSPRLSEYEGLFQVSSSDDSQATDSSQYLSSPVRDDEADESSSDSDNEPSITKLKELREKALDSLKELNTSYKEWQSSSKLMIALSKEKKDIERKKLMMLKDTIKNVTRSVYYNEEIPKDLLEDPSASSSNDSTITAEVSSDNVSCSSEDEESVKKYKLYDWAKKLLLSRYRTNRERNLQFSLKPYRAEDFQKFFRMSKSEFNTIFKSFKFEFSLIKEKRGAFVVSTEEALLITFLRLSHVSESKFLPLVIGRSESQICRISNFMVKFLFERYKERIYLLEDMLTPSHLQEYKAAVDNLQLRTKDGTIIVNNVIAFIGTSVLTDTPKEPVQQEDINNTSKKHGLKYQIVVSPQGMVLHASLLTSTRHHDLTVLKDSKILEKMTPYLSVDDEVYKVLGDKGYETSTLDTRILASSTKRQMKRDANGELIGAEETNKQLAKIHIMNESIFKIIRSAFPFPFRTFHRVGSTLLPEMVQVCCLLANCQTLVRGGNEISDYFESVPTLKIDQYLNHETLEMREGFSKLFTIDEDKRVLVFDEAELRFEPADLSED